MKCPATGEFLVTSFKDSEDQNVPEFHGIIRQVSILGFEGKVAWHTDKEGLHVSAEGIESDFPVVLRIITA
jgi:alpha-L-fucosidase